MRFTFVVPGLASLDRAALASSRPLARLASWTTARAEPRGFAAALLAAAGAPAPDAAHDVPAAPLAALGAGVDPRASFVLAAEPVHLIAGREDVSVAARVDDLDADEARALVAALNAHFASDGIAFAAPRPDTWFATMDARQDLVTVPLDDAVGSMMSSHMPAGGAARTWRRWTTEIQMLLHAHPVNLERERAGRAVCNGLWFWGGGTLADVGLVAPFRAHAPGGRAGDLLRGLAQHAGGETLMRPGSFEATFEAVPATRPASHVAVLLPAVADASALEELDRAWLAPAVASLARGRLASITLVAGGGRAATWITRRPSMLSRLVAGVAPRRFAVPGR
ncbi:hypothetical protein BURK1_02875 [Burkholderiales bacterium]|nr:hypothetical protein BURK1_02875 [Burkholderiales bacterium]